MLQRSTEGQLKGQFLLQGLTGQEDVLVSWSSGQKSRRESKKTRLSLNTHTNTIRHSETHTHGVQCTHDWQEQEAACFGHIQTGVVLKLRSFCRIALSL